MNINELMNKYEKCMELVCNKNCHGCEFDMPNDVWEACGVIGEYLEKVNTIP